MTTVSLVNWPSTLKTHGDWESTSGGEGDRPRRKAAPHKADGSVCKNLCGAGGVGAPAAGGRTETPVESRAPAPGSQLGSLSTARREQGPLWVHLGDILGMEAGGWLPGWGQETIHT